MTPSDSVSISDHHWSPLCLCFLSHSSFLEGFGRIHPQVGVPNLGAIPIAGGGLAPEVIQARRLSTEGPTVSQSLLSTPAGIPELTDMSSGRRTF